MCWDGEAAHDGKGKGKGQGWGDGERTERDRRKSLKRDEELVRKGVDGWMDRSRNGIKEGGRK